MAKKTLVVCEICGGTTPSGAADFVVFHCLTFCSPDCRDDYRAAADERRTKKDRAATKSRAQRSRAA